MTPSEGGGGCTQLWTNGLLVCLMPPFWLIAAWRGSVGHVSWQWSSVTMWHSTQYHSTIVPFETGLTNTFDFFWSRQYQREYLSIGLSSHQRQCYHTKSYLPHHILTTSKSSSILWVGWILERECWSYIVTSLYNESHCTMCIQIWAIQVKSPSNKSHSLDDSYHTNWDYSPTGIHSFGIDPSASINSFAKNSSHNFSNRYIKRTIKY
jgi:hypothetical protein